ncbi:hypothetical protein [Cellulomonas sp. URHB0016]
MVPHARPAWRAEVGFATRLVELAPSRDVAADDAADEQGSGAGSRSLREVLPPMIERDADLLRERIDSRLGR